MDMKLREKRGMMKDIKLMATVNYPIWKARASITGRYHTMY
jgi:hypothetical protein